jgi:CRP-like cAMP-binding protein
MIRQTTNAHHAASVMIAPQAGTAEAGEPWFHDKGVRVKAARDDVLFNEGDEARSCYRIVSGAIRMVKILADGRRYVVDFLLAGDVIGLDGGATYEFTAEAIVESELVRYARPRLEAEFDENPQAGRRLLGLMMRRLAAAQSQMLLLGRMSAMERVATFLLNLERRLGAPRAASRTIWLDMTRTDIADHLGLTIETVSRMLNQLKRRGIIALPHPQEIRVLRPGALAQLACCGADERGVRLAEAA